MTKQVSKIADSLKDLAYPTKNLKFLPGNSRKGDVPSVAASLQAYGQLKSIVCRKEENGDEIVLAGNTTLRAALQLGWTEIAVTWAEHLSPHEAVGFAVDDNHTAELGETDEELLRAQLEYIQQDQNVWENSTFNDSIFEELLESLEIPETPIPEFDDDGADEEELDEEDIDDSPPAQRPPGNPVIKYDIIFDDEDQQQTWFKFVRWLKKTNPDAETVSERLTDFIEGILPEE